MINQPASASQIPKRRQPSKTAALIVAAGRGTRAGAGLPKQWRNVAGKRVADWTVAAFAQHSDIDHVLVVVHSDDMDQAATLGQEYVTGGATRDASVRCGLEALEGRGFDAVLIHDVARAGISQDCISAVLQALAAYDGAAPALSVTDALWRGESGLVAGTQNRENLYRAQTPQGFHFDAILTAHRSFVGTQDAPAADDVEVARAGGLNVAIVAGEENNLKITTAEDFARMDKILRSTQA